MNYLNQPQVDAVVDAYISSECPEYVDQLQELRCYHFGNFYLSSIQQGIQSAHAQMEMFLKYEDDTSSTRDMLYDWAKYYKTMICLNGGTYKELIEIEDMLDDDENPYPTASFYEDISLKDMLTNVAIVLPYKIFNSAELVRKRTHIISDNQLFITPQNINPTFGNYRAPLLQFTDIEVYLINLLNSCGLAR